MTEPALDPLVLETLRQLTPEGEADVLVEILKLFALDVPTRLTRLVAAIEAGDATVVQALAHSIGGSAGNIGAVALHAASRRLDATARTGDLSDAPALAVRLQAEYGRVADQIRTLVT